MLEFTVRPKRVLSGGFPVDMLRYDRCFPYSEQDSVKISYFLSRYIRDDVETMREMLGKGIKLTSDHNFEPTLGRWESFGWTIVDKR